MEIGGLMAFAFKIFLGNPDIVLTLTVWTFLAAMSITAIRMSTDVEEMRD